MPQDAQAYRALASNEDYQWLVDAVARNAQTANNQLRLNVVSNNVQPANDNQGREVIKLDGVLTSTKVKLLVARHLIAQAAGIEDHGGYEDLRAEFHHMMKTSLAKVDSKKETDMVLPSTPLGEFFDGVDVPRLAQLLAISVADVHKHIKSYEEKQPEIGERGSRLLSKKWTRQMYMDIARWTIIDAKEEGFKKISLVLPFIEGATHLSQILEGRFKSKEVLMPSLNDAIREAVGESGIEVQVGVSLDAPTATFFKDGIEEIVKLIKGPIFINLRALTTAIWSAYEPDLFKPGAVGEKYAADIWGKNIFKSAPPEVLSWVEETVVKAGKAGQGRVYLVSENALDADMFRLARHSGATGVVLEANDNDLMGAAILQTGQVSARYGVGYDAAMFTGLKTQRNADLGGISLDAGMLSMTIKRDGNGMPLPMNLQSNAIIHLNGLRPVIKSIEIVNVLQLLGQ